MYDFIVIILNRTIFTHFDNLKNIPNELIVSNRLEKAVVHFANSGRATKAFFYRCNKLYMLNLSKSVPSLIM